MLEHRLLSRGQEAVSIKFEKKIGGENKGNFNYNLQREAPIQVIRAACKVIKPHSPVKYESGAS